LNNILKTIIGAHQLEFGNII